MDQLKAFITKNFESVFIFLLIFSVGVINYFVVQKIAFLNFYFLPVIVSGYYLGQRRSVLSAVLCIALITLYFLIFPDHFTLESEGSALKVHLLIWGSFLILAGAVVGKLQEKLQHEKLTTQQLNEQLLINQQELSQVNISLKDYNENLEEKISQRTAELAKSSQVLEKLKVKVEDTLYSTMDPVVAKLIIERRLRDEKKKISVMFTDLTGFTAYSGHRQPELVVRDLNRYFGEMESVLFTYNAHIDKYLGDGIMCEFGTPLDFSNYHLMAVVCAIKMQEKMVDSNYPWKMRIGIASGTAIMGMIGSRRQSYTTIGDVVNMASRFENACPSGSILIDHSTMKMVLPFIDVQLKQDAALSDSLIKEISKEIGEIDDQLLIGDDNKHEQADLYHQLGQLYLSIMEVDKAVVNFEQAVQLSPENNDFKISFAEASMYRDDCYKIQVKGKNKRVAAYEVVGIKDALLDRKKIPAPFYETWEHVAGLIEIPEDVILPAEVLDGCIGHGRVVAVLCYAVATELGIESEQEKKTIMQAGFLADIGIEAVPHYLLERSTASLNSTEYEKYLSHCIEGTRLLKQHGYQDEQLLGMVYSSHEKYDGSGFPAELKGEDIPLGARIIAVADAYDTLTSCHPCQEKWDMEVAFDELQHSVLKGDFDPEVVQAFLRVLKEETGQISL